MSDLLSRVVSTLRYKSLTFVNCCSTIVGKNDEENRAAIKLIGKTMAALKPRVATVENTSGLVNYKANQVYLQELLKDMRSAGPGYNVRYKVVNMADYGLPQQRKRLIIIASR